MREGKFIEPELKRNAEGTLVLEFPYEVQWPTVGLTSSECGKLPVHERFRQLAKGYVWSAKCLTTALGENPDQLDWPKASAACFCLYHATELFIKACILFRCPTEKLIHHDVAELKLRYHELYPRDIFFSFQCLWSIRVKDVERAFGVEPSGHYFDGKSDQMYRYLADKDGNPPEMVTFFFPGTWLKQMEFFEEDMERVWENILERYSSD